jgi:hypothetical protein
MKHGHMIRTPPPDEGRSFGRTDVGTKYEPGVDWEAERQRRVNNRRSDRDELEEMVTTGYAPCIRSRFVGWYSLVCLSSVSHPT